MGLVTNRVCSLLLTLTIVSGQLQSRTSEHQWSKRSSSDWIPLTGPCVNCQPNDRISSESDQVARLLTPPVADQQILSYEPQQKQFREQRPVAQPLVQQSNVHQQFVSLDFFAPKSHSSSSEKTPNYQTPFVQTTPPQFLQQSNGGVKPPTVQENLNLVTDRHNQFIPPQLQQEFPSQEQVTQLIAQESHLQFNTDLNQNRNNPYSQFGGQFFQQRPQDLTLTPQTSEESKSSQQQEEKPEVQLVYVPVEALNNRGRFNIPYKQGSNTLTELKGDLQLQQEPTALAAEESRQQRQQFQPYFEQSPFQPQTQTQTPNPVQYPQVIISTEQPQLSNDKKVYQQATREELQVKNPQLTEIPKHVLDHQQQSLSQQLLQSLRTHPTGIPQQLHQQQQQQQPHQVSHAQLGVPIQAPFSTRAPDFQQQIQQQTHYQPLINQEDFLTYLRPLPTLASQLVQQQEQQTQEQRPSPATRPHETQVSELKSEQSPNEDRFPQTEKPYLSSTAQAQEQKEYVTHEPQFTAPPATQRPSAPQPQQHRQAATQTANQQPPNEYQQVLTPTKLPQLPKVERRFPQPTVTAKPSKPVPHQPPLAVYMGRDGHEIKLADVIRVLKNAKTIAVLDSVGPESPQVFVGPSNLKPPLSYAKFELPYLSSIESNRVERKVDRLPFFVAPLNFNPPAGYSKIPFPAPHIGSVVVSNTTDRDLSFDKDATETSTIKPTRGRFSSQYSLPADLPAINPQLPTLVNSLQDAKAIVNAHLSATREQTIVQPYPTGSPYQPTTPQSYKQIPRHQRIKQYQEIRQVSEAPPTLSYPVVPRTPQVNNYQSVQRVTTPQPQYYSIDQQRAEPDQFSQVPTSPKFPQTLPPAPSAQPSQFPQTNLRQQEIPELSQYPSQVGLISPNSQSPQIQLTQVNPVSEIPQFQHFPAPNQELPTFKTQQFQENSEVTQPPQIQFYNQEKEAPKQQPQIAIQEVETERPPQELPSTPLPTSPRRRPSYRVRHRTTEAPTTEETSTTTRRPYTRGRRPYVSRHRGQQQEPQTQHHIASTVAPHSQFIVDVEPSSTTEFFTGFKYSSRAPTRSKTETTFQDNKPSVQEEKPRRNNVLRTRSRTRERNSHRVQEQNVPQFQNVPTETKSPNLNLQDEQDPVVPPHESRRQQSANNQYYNTERSGFEVSTTEHSRFEQVNSNLPQQSSNSDVVAHQQVLNVNDQGEAPIPQTPSFLNAYRTDESDVSAISPAKSEAIPSQEINYQVFTTTAQPEINSFVPYQTPQSAERPVRVHPQLVSEQPARYPQFSLPVQVSVSGQTETPEIEETPRPVYVRIRGQTRGRRPQNHGTEGTQRAVPRHHQQESPQRIVPSNIPREQHQALRQRLPVIPSQAVRDDVKVVSPKPEESEEEYGFISSVSFPTLTANRHETVEPDYSGETQSQESRDSGEDRGQSIPVHRERQNFLVRSNKRPTVAIEESTTPVTTVFTVRPSRRQNAVKQQVRITSIRGRMRRPTTSTTEPTQPIYEPTSTESQFLRHPSRRVTPSLSSANEVSGETHEAFPTPRSSLQRYESPARGINSQQNYVVANEDQTFVEGSSTPSAFQITLLDDPANYPSLYNKQSRGQNQGYVQENEQVNSDSLPRYYNEDPEGGAESQWATKRLPFVYSANDASTISMITFTTELPSNEQTVTEIPLTTNEENVANSRSSSGHVESSNNIPVYQGEEPSTTQTTTELPSRIFDEGEDKTLRKDQSELASSQKKANDHNTSKKTNANRRGTWVRVRKVQRPQDVLETAESQNIGALSMNRLQGIVSKGSQINSWSSPPPTVVLNEPVFHVETADDITDDDLVKVVPTNVHDNGFGSGQTFGNEDKSLLESFATTTEINSFTEEYRNEESSTLAVTPRPAEDTTTSKVQLITSLTTDSPIIETTTREDLTKTIEVIEVNPTRSNDENIEQNINVNAGNKTNDQDKEKGTATDSAEDSDNGEINNNEQMKRFETTTESEFKTTEKTITSSIDQFDDEDVKKISFKSNDKPDEDLLMIQSSVRDAIHQNTPTAGTTDHPDILQESDYNSETTTEAGIISPDEIVQTSMRTEVSHETEICFRGRCVKTKTVDNDHLEE